MPYWVAGLASAALKALCGMFMLDSFLSGCTADAVGIQD
jgi:hypothetical protein